MSFLLPALSGRCPLGVSPFAKDLSSIVRAQVDLLALQLAKQDFSDFNPALETTEKIKWR